MEPETVWQELYSVTTESYLQNVLQSSYGLIRVDRIEEEEVIFLNGLRWKPKAITWSDLLQALEGDAVHLRGPKTFFRRDLELTADITFFALADAPIMLIQGSTVNFANTEKVNVH